MREVVELPERLAILPFANRVLLPGAIVQIRCTSPTSVRLVEQELWQKEETGLIGVLPVRDAQIMSSQSMVESGANGEKDGKGGTAGASDYQAPLGKQENESVQFHPRGVAARALHLSRGMEKPSGRVTYTVVLEGWCRFSVKEMNAKGPYNTASVVQLDMTQTEMDQAEKDPEVQAIARQFKIIAGELISFLEQKHRKIGQTKVLLDTAPAHRLADIFVASFEGSFQERLAMLDAVDLKQRLTKAIELVTRHLHTIKVAEKISQKVEG